MIVNHENRFVFIHIPKCAGTTVRKPLQKFDSFKGKFTNRVGRHPFLGNLDYVHIPLVVLREYFPEQYQCACDYWSFSVVRDPFARFASSLSQHLKMYSHAPIQKRAASEVRQSIDEIIEYLSSQPAGGVHLLPPEYIHFQKQVDYIQLSGQRIVDTLYTVDAVGRVLADVGERVGEFLVPSEEQRPVHANQTVVVRNESLRRVLEAVRPVTKRLGVFLSEDMKQHLRNWVYVPRDKRLQQLFAADHVQDFIRDYYAADILLYGQVRELEEVEASSENLHHCDGSQQRLASGGSGRHLRRPNTLAGRMSKLR